MKKNIRLGILFAVISNIVGGIQPIVANSRPIVLDAHIFSGMAAVIQALLFLPIFLIEKKIFKNKSLNKKEESSVSVKKLYFGQSKYNLFIIIGLMFSLVMFLYYQGLSLAGSINGTLGLKTTAIFGLLFGYILLKEKITKVQILFSIVLFFGMTFAITQGAFYLIEINIGVIMILICAAIWMFGHSCSKGYLQVGKTTSSELIFWRNFFTAIVLIISYLFIYGPQKIMIIFDPINAFFYLIMGITYGVNLFSWYQILKYLDVSIGTILITPQLIVTSYLGYLILGEPFTIYHLIGLIIMLVSIVMINTKSRSK